MASLSEAPHIESFMPFPPGFKFYPTDQELIYFYLRKKVNKEKLPTNPIREVNIYLYNPVDLAAMYRDYEGHDGWYFFTPRDRKYPNGKRPNRSANNGYWKATGADKKVCHGDQIIGYKRTLVFYHGKPPKGTKTDWIMHEYTLKEPIRTRTSPNDMKLDEWVLCKIYERRKRLEDAEDNDQTQLSTLSQYLLHPLHQLLPQVPSEISQKPQQTPPPPSQPPQLVTSAPLYMDAHEVNTYNYNPQPMLLSPPPLSQPQHTQMFDLPPQDAQEVNTYSLGQLSPWNNPQPVLLPSLPLSLAPQQSPLPLSQPTQMVESPPQDAQEVNTYNVGLLSPWSNPQPMLLPPLPLSQAPQQNALPLSQPTQLVDSPQDAQAENIYIARQQFPWKNPQPALLAPLAFSSTPQYSPLPLSQSTQMIDSPPRDALKLNMYIARQHSPWNNSQPALLPPPVVSLAPQYTPPPLSLTPWYTTFLLEDETSDDDQFFP